MYLVYQFLITLVVLSLSYGGAKFLKAKLDEEIPIVVGMILSAIILAVFAALAICVVATVVSFPIQSLMVVLAAGVLFVLVKGRKILPKISFSKIKLPKFRRAAVLTEFKQEPTKRSIYEVIEKA